VWWCSPVIPAVERQEDHKFKPSLDYMTRPCQKREKKGEGIAVQLSYMTKVNISRTPGD
jgi:hypothetical protein